MEAGAPGHEQEVGLGCEFGHLVAGPSLLSFTLCNLEVGRAPLTHRRLLGWTGHLGLASKTPASAGG